MSKKDDGPIIDMKEVSDGVYEAKPKRLGLKRAEFIIAAGMLVTAGVMVVEEPVVLPNPDRSICDVNGGIASIRYNFQESGAAEFGNEGATEIAEGVYEGDLIDWSTDEVVGTIQINPDGCKATLAFNLRAPIASVFKNSETYPRTHKTGYSRADSRQMDALVDRALTPSGS